MFINIDKSKRKKEYKIHLAKPNNQKIANLSEAHDSVYSLKLGNINELSFNIPYFIDKEDHRIENENIELMKQKMYLEIDYNNSQEWMIVDEMEDFGDGKEKYLSVTAFSNVYENSHKMIRSLELKSVNPDEYYSAILQDTAWSIGEIDSLFKDIYRSFDINNSTVLESILTGAETYGAILDFDSKNKTINLLDMESRAEYRGLNINYKNFLQSVSRKSSADEMTTRMYVYGSDGMTITNANPTGMPYIEDFSYFLYPFERDENKNVIKSSNYMSDELAHAMLDLAELNEQYQPTIKQAQDRIDIEIVDLIESETILSNLSFDLSTVKGLLDIAKATNDKDLISQRKAELVVAQSAVDSQEQEVENIKASIEYHEGEIARLQKLISVTSFSPKLLKELNPFIIEKDFSDDRYIDEKELYQDALENFEEARNPSYVVNASIDNIINSLEEEYYSDKVVLGDIARIVDKDMRVDMKSLITEMTFSMDENSHNITISEGDIDVDGYDRILSILYNTQSTTTMLSNNKDKWDAVTEIKSEVDMMRDASIDATKNRIYAGINESIEIGDRGIVLSNPDFPNEMVIMQAGVIALSKDGGETWDTSITPDGVIADTIIGKLIASNNLLITNDKGSFRVDSEGLTVDMDSIKIMSGEGDTPQNIVDSWNAILVTMDEFANDSLLNPYEKSQIKKQWESIQKSHSSMVEIFIEGIGPETEDNPYPLEYRSYMIAYEKLNDYLNKEIQSDGHVILDPNNMNNTTDIDSVKYKNIVDDYQLEKEKFQTIIPLEFSQTYIQQLKDSISLNYVKNGEVISSLELYEDGTRINGKFLDITAQTNFNDDVVMNAGVIRSKDNAISIDLNSGLINLSRPLTINYKPVATKEDLKDIELTPGPEGKTAYDIAVDNGFVGTESQWIQSLIGTKGKDGKTAYEVALDEGFEGTKNEWLNSLKGAKGDTGERGATGNQGPRGATGTSVESIEEFYLATDQDSGITTETKGWSSAIQIISPSNKYLWNYEEVTFSDDNKQNTLPVIIGTYGEKGEDGSEGRSIIAINEFYLATNQEVGVTRDTGDWTQGMQLTTPDKRYLWNYEEIIWNSGEKKTYVEPIVIGVHGLKGDKGETGERGATGSRGPQGAHGTSVESIKEFYLATDQDSGITNKSSGWKETLQSMTATNKYLWNYEQIKFSDGSTQDTLAVIIGVYGDKGSDGEVGRSIVGIEERYLATSADTGITRDSSGWIKTVQKTTPTDKYLWNYEIISWSSGERETYTNPIIIGVHGEKGPKGDTGARGATGSRGPEGAHGTSITGIVEYYALSKSAGTTPIDWTKVETASDMPIMTATNKYLWNKEEITFSDENIQETLPVVIGIYGDKGDSGSTGATGRSIVGVEDFYLATTASSGVTRSTSEWKPGVQPTSSTKRYLWNYEKVTWSTAPIVTYVEPIIIGIHGDTGPQGPQGPKGATGSRGPIGNTGTSVESITEYYLATSESSGVESTNPGFKTTMQEMTATNKYLWNYEKINFSDDTSQPTIPVIIGVYGDKGQTGGTGATGRSIVSITEHYLSTSANSGVTRSTSGWDTKMQPTTETERYLWNYETIKWSSGTTPTYVEPIIIGVHGAKGPQGTQGIQGLKGTDGQSQWVHIRYSVNANGNPMDAKPASTTKYIGIAVTNSSTAPANTGFTWSKFIGEDGNRGVPGLKGTDGKTTYTWVKYADDIDGNGIDDSPSGKMFIGLAFNKTTQSETSNPSDYAWSAMYDEEAFKGVGLADKTEILSGTEIYTDKADDSVVHVEIDGKSVGGGNGKNMLRQSFTAYAPYNTAPVWDEGLNKITFTMNATGYVAIGVRDWRPENKTYTLSGIMKKNGLPVTRSSWSGGRANKNIAVISLSVDDATGRFEVTQTWNGSQSWVMDTGFNTASGDVVTIENFQLEEGSTATSYELPAPTPDYPIEIHSLNDFDVVSDVGRNLLVGSKDYSGTWVNRAQWVVSSDTYKGTLIASRTGTWVGLGQRFNVFKGEQYTFSAYVKSTGTSVNLYLTNSYDSASLSPSSRDITLKPDTWTYVVCTVSVSSDGVMFPRFELRVSGETVYVSAMKFEKGNIATDWTPAPEDITENDNHPLIDKINLSLNEPLRSVGDVKDRLFRDDSDGLWKIERNVGERKFTGDENGDTASIHISLRVPNRLPSKSAGVTDEVVATHFPAENHSIYNNPDKTGWHTRVRERETSVFFNYAGKTGAELRQWFKDKYNSGDPVTIQYLLDNIEVETLDQEFQDKLNNLRSFQDFNYLYTVINDETDILSERLKPTLHATFKGGGWYSRWKTEQELERHQKELDDKADMDLIDNIQDQLEGFVDNDAYTKDVGDINEAMEEYLRLLQQAEEELNGVKDPVTGELISEGIKDRLGRLLKDSSAVTTNFDDFSERWNFLDNSMVVSDDGLFMGDSERKTGVFISNPKHDPVTGEQIEPSRIDFLDSGSSVAHISGNLMEISNGIFVKSLTVGEHKIETIAGGHTIWQWV